MTQHLRWMSHVKILFPFDIKNAIDNDCLHIRRLSTSDNTSITTPNSASFVIAYEHRKSGTNDKYDELELWCVSVLPEGRVLYSKLNDVKKGTKRKQQPQNIQVVKEGLKLTKRDKDLMMRMEQNKDLTSPDDWVILKTNPASSGSDCLSICPQCNHASFVAEYVE